MRAWARAMLQNGNAIRAILVRIGRRWMGGKQFELIDGRENIFEKYFKLMLAIHRTDPATFEYIKFETDLFWKAETVGHFNENSLLTDTISSIEVDLKKLRRLLTK